MHPDLGFERTAAEERLLKDAIEAYEYRDVHALRSIALALEDSGTDYRAFRQDEDILTVLAAKICVLYKRKEDLEKSLKQIKTEFPFKYEDFLSQPLKVEKRQRKLEKEIREEKEKLEKLKSKLMYYKCRCIVAKQ